LSLISLNINGLNSPIKRHRLTDWICKQDLAFCCIQETYLNDKNLEGYHTSNLTAYMKALEQKEPNTPKRIGLQEKVKFRAEINQLETKRTIQRISKTKTWFFEKNIKIDKPLVILTKGHRVSSLINKIRNEK
jgi:exonuclease III